MNEHEFRSLTECLQHSHEFIDIVRDSRRGVDRVCHHNAYLIARLLEHLGQPMEWVNGVYLCANSAKKIHHSWLATTADAPALIFEFDPHQLQRSADYEDDLMPGPRSDWGVVCANTAVIVDPARVTVPQAMKEFKWIVASAEVLKRYQTDPTFRPEIDRGALDDIAADAIGTFEHFRELRAADKNDD